VIYEWKLDNESRNFGDALPEAMTPPDIYQDWADDPEVMYFPIGSVICNDIIAETLYNGYKPVFIGCGWRGEELDPALVIHCEFYGARGPHTQAELARHGIEVEVVGDPAYMLPQIFAKSAPNGLAMVIRHVLDESDYTPNTIHEYGADAVFSPVVHDEGDIIAVIEKISGARFVLAGSMHAAIVAHAYDVPFALLDGPYIDCLPKWYDWFASVNLGEPEFVSNIVEGRKWYNEKFRDRKPNGTN
jgi:hypothetical protein